MRDDTKRATGPPRAHEEGEQTGGAPFNEETAAAILAISDMLEQQRAAIESAQYQIRDVLASRTWRWLCAAGGILQKLLGLPPISTSGGSGSTSPDWASYLRWIDQFERPDRALARFKLRCLNRQPKISVIMAVFQPAAEHLERAIASVSKQIYPHWELCIADDCSRAADVDAVLQRHQADEPRIRVTTLGQHAGISAALNAALALASGEFVAVLDHDDELAPEALFHVADAIGRHPEANVLYSDEDRIDAAGRRCGPFFKPDWSPDLLLSENYICHLLVARRELIEASGGFRSAYDGSQDYDLILRLSEVTGEIVHIPKVLYHWRVVEGSAGSDRGGEPFAAGAARRAIEAHLDRADSRGRVEEGLHAGRWRVRYPIPAGARVSVIIPSAGQIKLLEANLSSIVQRTTYPDYELTVIDNSRSGAVERFLRHWQRHGRAVRYVDWRRRPFNFAAMNNAAARATDAPFLLFLNDDTEVITPGWLEAMVELGARPEVGAVGAKLLYPDGRIQHAGVVLGVLGHVGHAFWGLDGSARHYFDLPDVIRNVSAVTGACLLVRSSVFREAGGFNESGLPVDFSDIDLCLKLRQRGYRVLYTPHAVLLHHESASRREGGLPRDDQAARIMRTLWGEVLDNDPFYSPNLTRAAGGYRVRV
ncbi:MAG: glycosyltransferase [Bryobacteraceae bacterium]